jgi:hypothetical protein
VHAHTHTLCVYCTLPVLLRRLRCPYGKLVVLQELATDLSLHRLAALCVQQLPYQARQAWATANNTSTTATSSATTAVATDSTSGVVVVPQSALESDLSGLVGCAQHADLRIVLHGEHYRLPLVLIQLPIFDGLRLHCVLQSVNC